MIAICNIDVVRVQGVRKEKKKCNVQPRLFIQKMAEQEKDAPANMEMTLRMTFSTLWTGLQRSDADSYMVGSSPGACKMEMQTLPSA